MNRTTFRAALSVVGIAASLTACSVPASAPAVQSSPSAPATAPVKTVSPEIRAQVDKAVDAAITEWQVKHWEENSRNQTWWKNTNANTPGGSK